MDPMFPDYKPNKISNSLSMSLCPLPHRQRGTGKRFIRNESVDEPADPPCIPILLGHSWPLEQDSVEQDVFFHSTADAYGVGGGIRHTVHRLNISQWPACWRASSALTGCAAPDLLAFPW